MTPEVPISLGIQGSLVGTEAVRGVGQHHFGSVLFGSVLFMGGASPLEPVSHFGRSLGRVSSVQLAERPCILARRSYSRQGFGRAPPSDHAAKPRPAAGYLHTRRTQVAIPGVILPHLPSHISSMAHDASASDASQQRPALTASTPHSTGGDPFRNMTPTSTPTPRRDPKNSYNTVGCMTSEPVAPPCPIGNASYTSERPSVFSVTPAIGPRSPPLPQYTQPYLDPFQAGSIVLGLPMLYHLLPTRRPCTLRGPKGSQLGDP